MKGNWTHSIIRDPKEGPPPVKFWLIEKMGKAFLGPFKTRRSAEGARND